MAQSLCQFLMVVAFLTVAAADSKCAVGWSYFEGSCYHVGRAGASFMKAKSECRDLESRLVTLTSPGENTFIKSILKDDDAIGVWFGLILTQRDLRFKWNNFDGGVPISFTDWGDNTTVIAIDLPDNRKRTREIQCGSFSKQYDWAWEPKPCRDGTGMKHVCKRCATEQVCTSRTCFRVLCKRDRHFVAGFECNHLGGTLATIRSEEESKIIKDFLDQVTYNENGWGKAGGEVWLAGSDEDSEGVWYWETNHQRETISDDVFTDWAQNEPNNAGSARFGEDCMALTVGDWKWTDLDCSKGKFGLCEIPVPDVNPITG